jgi:hypothetical protein
LGVIITSSGNLVKDIKTQAQTAARVACCLNYLVWRNKIYVKGNKIRNIHDICTPDNDICTGNKGRNIINRQMLEVNEMKVLRKITVKIKIVIIKGKQP